MVDDSQALCSVNKLPAIRRRQLLQPKPDLDAPSRQGQAAADGDLPEQLRSAFKEQYNDPQRAAVATCLAGQGKFSLIQVCFSAYGPRECVFFVTVHGIFFAVQQRGHAARRLGQVRVTIVSIDTCQA